MAPRSNLRRSPPPRKQKSLPPPPPRRGSTKMPANNIRHAQNPNPNVQSSQKNYSSMPPRKQDSPYQQQPPPPSSPPPPTPPLPSSPPPPIPPPHHSAPPPLPSAKKEQSQKPPVPSSGKNRNERIAETEEERRLRKRREYEKLKTSEKSTQQNLRGSQQEVLGKAVTGHASISGSQLMSDRRSGASVPLLSRDGTDNRLKKPTPFLCQLRFHNELPDPSAKGMLLELKRDPNRFCRMCEYQPTSLDKTWNIQLDVKPDLGIPLDLLDLSVYNPPENESPHDPEDVGLYRDDDPVMPVKTAGIKRKERPSEKGVSWLRKTDYTTPFSMRSYKKSTNNKPAKELQEARDEDLLENNNNGDMQIQDIPAPHNVHEVNR